MQTGFREENCGRVQSVLRAVCILRILAHTRDGANLKTVAEQSGLASSTVHRLLTTLESERFVTFDREHARWRLGDGILSIAAQVDEPALS